MHVPEDNHRHFLQRPAAKHLEVPNCGLVPNHISVRYRSKNRLGTHLPRTTRYAGKQSMRFNFARLLQHSSTPKARCMFLSPFRAIWTHTHVLPMYEAPLLPRLHSVWMGNAARPTDAQHGSVKFHSANAGHDGCTALVATEFRQARMHTLG